MHGLCATLNPASISPPSGTAAAARAEPPLLLQLTLTDFRIQQPEVTVHYAQTLDGRIATRTGNSRWISCGETLRFAHQLRADHEAVMVGVGTVIADDPLLTVRHVPGSSPRRVVLDTTLRIPLTARVLTDSGAPTTVVTTARAPVERARELEERGVTVLTSHPADDGRVDLEDALNQLLLAGISSVLVEGGSAVITSALRLRVVDRLVVCIAPKVIGEGVNAIGNLDVATMEEAHVFSDARFTQVGSDVVFDGRIGQ